MTFFLQACSQRVENADEVDLSSYQELSLDERQSPAHALDAMQTSEGLSVQLFAAEPMVVNPTNMTVDARGRVWICESPAYALGQDQIDSVGGRIVILSDTSGDGQADKKQVFYEGKDIHLALGIAVLGNKVYVTRSPNLLVFTDPDQDDIPDAIDTLFTGMGGPGDHSAHAVVFGPDGRYYFNYGNAGKEVRYADGRPVVDLAGNQVVSNGKPYHGGMVFRFAEGGQQFETLAHNFRNNYEVAIDAFGNLWQSDNDDDGNRSVRMNYILEYGNYGYLDEYTGLHWAHSRIGMHDSIHMRHWHQNDPGVVPNLLITGAGSPAGITIYEGTLLPEIFHGQPIHADAGPNVVRAYPVKTDGAGFSATVHDILHSKWDQWFRPVDVAVAPDGSLFVADWYDPIVGGGAAGDHTKGRVFRIAPSGSNYQVPLAIDGVEGDINLLLSPNESARYEAYQRLLEGGTEVLPILEERLAHEEDARSKARILWLAARISADASKYIKLATSDPDDRIRIIGIRIARQLNTGIIPDLEALVTDPSPAVRRELAIALRYELGPTIDQIWAQLALQHTGDRWYLEALGIGADLNWDARLKSWLSYLDSDAYSQNEREIIWRSRAQITGELLRTIIGNSTIPSHEHVKFFRAFQFQDATQRQQALLQILNLWHPQKEAINVMTLQLLDPTKVPLTPSFVRILDAALNRLKGTWQFVDLVENYQVKNRRKELLEMGAESFENKAAFSALRILATTNGWNGLALIEEAVEKNDSMAEAIVHGLKGITDRSVLQFLSDIMCDTVLQYRVRKRALDVLSSSWSGEDVILTSVQRSDFPADLKEPAAAVLFSVYRTSIHLEAAEYLDRPVNTNDDPISPIRVLVATQGNANKGSAHFTKYCQSCHIVKGQGVQFGPELSQIGSKMDKEGLYRSILYPNEGVSYGYETYYVMLDDGSTILGLLESETTDKIHLKLMGDIKRVVEKKQVVEFVQLSTSLMPDLSVAMSEEEIIDLVSFLTLAK
ncbi:MAG: c-type cytochrome [Saprospiraceae bacterium]|nr:c-type cytochrome [Saprospiraceae bacterium]